MNEIDHILNGKKVKHKPANPWTNIMGLSNPSSPRTDHVRGLFGTKNVKVDPLVQLYKGRGHPNPTDKITPAQRAKFQKALRKQNMDILFTDHDKDGVISGLDCAPKNPHKHGIPNVQRAQAMVTPQARTIEAFGSRVPQPRFEQARTDVRAPIGRVSALKLEKKRDPPIDKGDRVSIFPVEPPIKTILPVKLE